MKTQLSVIVPVYNTERFLRRCIESILNQNVEKCELILINDGSTDSSGKICDEYAKENQCISVIHRKNQGVGKARNNGVLASSGKYITFVDSDDYLPDDPTIYSKAISILENHDVDIVTWLWQFQNEEGKLTIDPHKIPTFFCGKKSMLEFAKGLYYGSYANGLVVGVCNKLYKRDYIKNILRCSAYDHVIFCWVLHRREIWEDLLRRLTEPYVLRAVSLVCTPETLRSRLEGDIRAGKRIPDVLDRSLAYLPLYDALDIRHLDVTALTPRETAECIRREGGA